MAEFNSNTYAIERITESSELEQHFLVSQSDEADVTQTVQIQVEQPKSMSVPKNGTSDCSPSALDADEWSARDVTLMRLRALGRGLSCKERTRVHWIRSKGAILVLLLNCFTFEIGTLRPVLAAAMPLYSLHNPEGILLAMTLIQVLSLLLPCPIAGWLADVYFGRYRVIKVSLWLMWTGATLLSFCHWLNMLLPSGSFGRELVPIIASLALFALEVGMVGFVANIIPFGIDQLSTASGDQLNAFITWFVFTLAIKFGISNLISSCPIGKSSRENDLFQIFSHTVLLSTALVLDALLKDWLIVEPSTSNPFKLVAGVLKYAWTHKYPKFRSAFTYQDHKKPSRIDYAKAIYGGPFSTEQVEDVKTFLRIISALVPMGAAIELAFTTIYGSTIFYTHLAPETIPCINNVANSNTPWLIVILGVLCFEFLLNPAFHGLTFTTLIRFGIGIIFITSSIVTLSSISIAEDSYRAETQNSTYICMFEQNIPFSSVTINHFWIILPQAIIGFGLLFLLTAVYVFVFSQSPHNMKGLLMGAIFATVGSFELLVLILQIPFFITSFKSLSTGTSCGSIYFIMLLVLGLICFVAYVLVAHRYQRREREDTKHHQNYTEDYFRKYLSRAIN